MTVKTNNVQKGGFTSKTIFRFLTGEKKTLYDSLDDRINNKEKLYKYLTGLSFNEKVPCFPELDKVTPMNGKRPIKEGNDLKNDIQIGINYALCQKCEGHNCNSCYISDVKCHYNDICYDDESATKYVLDKNKCFLNYKNLSFDDYYLANYFKMYSKIINDAYTYPKTRYIEKSDYDDFREVVSWKFPMLPYDFTLINDIHKPKYLSWENLYEYIKDKPNYIAKYGGKKSRKSRNKKRKSNKKKRKTVKKRRLRKQK